MLTETLIILAAVIYIGLSVTNGLVASMKGYNAGAFVGYSLLGFGLFVYLILLAAPTRPDSSRNTSAERTSPLSDNPATA